MQTDLLFNQSTLNSFLVQDRMMRYSNFVPRLYNYCLSLGFTRGKIMPSRAFCSDESQGFPTILLAKHFGAFPFNHGRVGGVVATNRHGPHAHHGKDLLLIQASHVGYDPETKDFGEYRRYQTEGECKSTNCGKIMATLNWYENELKLAQDNIFLQAKGDKRFVIIDNDLLRSDQKSGLILHHESIISADSAAKKTYSTSTRFVANKAFCKRLGDAPWQNEARVAIGDNLSPDLYHFRREIIEDTEGQSRLENNLFDAMPWILSSRHPALTAAKVNTLVEFDNTYRTILREPSYQGKNLLFIAGIHIDISPKPDQVFPLTKFIPWAAFHQDSKCKHQLIEQDELFQILRAQKANNNHQIDIEDAIQMMQDEQEVVIDTSA